MKCLLIDVGSTFIKYGVYEEKEQKILIENKVKFPAASVNDGVRFQVPVGKIQEEIRKIFSEVKSFECKKVYFSVQMHGYVIRTPKGELSEYISWRDKSGDICQKRFDNVDFQRMGTSLKNNLPLVKLPKEQAAGEFFTLGSYIVWMLTGVNATHITDACASGFFYADSGKYNEFYPKLQMPMVYTNIEKIGVYEGVAVYPPMGDHQISFLGSETGEEKYLVNIGTATQISCLAEKEFEAPDCEKRPYFSKELRLYTVSGLIGGDQLFVGGKQEILLEEVIDALKKLPQKKEILFGGGGAKQNYGYLKNVLEPRGIKCSLTEDVIGLEGLKMVAEQKRMKKGTMLSEITFPNFPLIAKNCGLDFLLIDGEHGAFDYSAMSALIMNANLIGLDTIIRIGGNQRETIIKYADMGAKGFLLPMTNCREDIAEVVKYAKYPPVGKRGVSTTRAHTCYNPPKLTEYMKTANSRMKIFAQIETREGIENLSEILQTEGITGVLIGPNDLSVDLECIDNKDTILECIESISSAAKSENRQWGIITKDAAYIAKAKECDADLISYGSELNMLIDGCKKISEKI